MVCIYYNLLTTQNLLLAPIHQMILMHAILLPLVTIIVLLRMLLLSSCASRENRTCVKIVVTLRFLWVCSSKFSLCSTNLRLLLYMMIVTILSMRNRSWNFIILWVHNLLLILAYLAGTLRISLTFVNSFPNFVISAITTLIYLLHLILILLECSLIIIDNNLLLGTSISIGSRGLLTLSWLHLPLTSGCSKTLFV